METKCEFPAARRVGEWGFLNNYRPLVAKYYRLFSAAIMPSFCVGGDLSAHSSVDWDWISDHFDKAFHDLFPIYEH
jgi:hypothetical protein